MKTAISWYHLGLRGRLFHSLWGRRCAPPCWRSSSAIISYGSLARSLERCRKESAEITRASEGRAAAVKSLPPRRPSRRNGPGEREHAVKV